MSAGNGHVQFIWSIAELLRGDYKRSEYGQVILPFTVLRRLDRILTETKQRVLDEAARAEGLDFDPDALLRRAAGQRFYNTSPLDLEKVAGDPKNATTGLRHYMAGFSPVVREIFEAFDFDQQITRLHKAKLLYRVLGKFLDPKLELHPGKVSNAQMGDIFEELIRRFSEASNETAGEHFTPREVVRLCARLVLAGEHQIGTPGAIRKVYDPACGTGGMLSITDELVRELNPRARLFLFGQERNPESWAICRSEMLLKGQDPSNIYPLSTLSEDGLPEDRFDLMLANPPFGVDWAKDYEAVTGERDLKGDAGRFGAGIPPKSDGALLFLQTMLAKRKRVEEGGSRIAIIFNGSPLFSGGAGSGPSNIRKWILENDWLEAIVALPEQLFYNTGIATYVWVLTNNKAPERRGKVQLIDGRELWEPMPKSLGDKRRRLGAEHIDEVIRLYDEFEEGERSRVRDNEFFIYRRITVERPLRLRYEVDDEAVERLKASSAFQLLAVPAANVKDPKAAIALGEGAQAALIKAVERRRGFTTTYSDEAEEVVREVLGSVEKPTVTLRRTVVSAFSRRDPDAPIATNARGEPEPDPVLRDHENVPLVESVTAYLAREVAPFAPQAWVDDSKEKVGSEIRLGQLFYRHGPPRAVEEIDAEIRKLELEIERLTANRVTLHGAVLGESTGSRPRSSRANLQWLPSIPTHWQVAKLTLVASLGTGHTPSRSEPAYWATDRDIPWITTGDIERFRDDRVDVLTDTKERISHIGLENSAAVVHPKGTVVLSRTASVGFSVVMGADMATSQDFATWTCSRLLEPRFLLICLRAMREELVGRLAVGSTHKTIYMHDIESLRIPLPPILEQEEIVQGMAQETRHLDEVADRVHTQLALLAERRDALLTGAASGWLVSPSRREAPAPV